MFENYFWTQILTFPPQANWVSPFSSREWPKSINPDNAFIPYLENYADFIKIAIGEDELLFDSLENKISERIEEVEKLSDTSRFKKYFLGNMNLQWATINLKFGNYFDGAVVGGSQC